MKLIGLLFIVLLSLSANAAKFNEGQVWKGWYKCAQGKTSLEIIINKVYDNDMKALFSFDYAGSQKGKFEMYGSYDPITKKLDFEPGEWIKKPRGYKVVGMNGKIYMGSTYIGKITGAASCNNFELKLVK